MKIDIDIDALLARYEAPFGSSCQREALLDALNSVICGALGLWTLTDADTAAADHVRSLELAEGAAIRNAFEPIKKSGARVFFGFVGEDKTVVVTKSTLNARPIYRFFAALPTYAPLPPCGRVLNDPVRDQHAVILKSLPTDVDGVYRVWVAAPTRRRSATLRVTEHLYAGRFLFPLKAGDTEQAIAAKHEADKRNFMLINARFEELQNLRLLP